jgi:hypothetical protein
MFRPSNTGYDHAPKFDVFMLARRFWLAIKLTSGKGEGRNVPDRAHCLLPRQIAKLLSTSLI